MMLQSVFLHLFRTGPVRSRAGWVGISSLGLLLSACSDSAAPLYSFWEGSLTPVLPGFVEGGVVAVTQHGKTDIGITIENGDPGVVYGWRIDSGSCQSPGEIQGGPASYPPLIPGQGGSASAETSIRSLFRPGEELAGRVFRSAAGGSEQVVACGNLEDKSD